MSPVMKQLIEEEEMQRKEKFLRGMYFVVYYLFIILSYMIAFLIGSIEEWAFGIVVSYIYMYSFAMETYIDSLFYVKEKGRKSNVFSKYMYIPVSIKMLCHAKLAVLFKQIGKTTLIAQILAILGSFMDGVEFSCVGQMFVPTYIGVGFVLVSTVRVHYRTRYDNSAKTDKKMS